jgi:hypothetical protein
MLSLHDPKLRLQFLILTNLLLICPVSILEVSDDLLVISEYLLIPVLPLGRLLILLFKEILLLMINPPLLIL